MKKSAMVFVLAIIFPAALAAGELTQKQEIQKVLHFKNPASEGRKVLVDNFNGSIEVVGYDGNDVQLVVHETFEAESDRRMREAQEKVTLQIQEEEDQILIYVDAPWRCKDGSSNYRGWEYYGYDVHCDFELKVPARLNTVLKTINDGRISVRGVQGNFSVRNVNGEVRMADIGGSGDATTVNGDVTVSFKWNPTEPSSFKTVNGKVDVTFQSGLSADLRLKTFNGEAYTDFSVEALPPKEPRESHSKMRKVYSRDQSMFVRVGKGGPELSFDTLNGNIYIERND